MTSREHARRLMLILLSSPGRPGVPERRADGDDERDERVVRDGGSDAADPDDRRSGLVQALIWT